MTDKISPASYTTVSALVVSTGFSYRQKGTCRVWRASRIERGFSFLNELVKAFSKLHIVEDLTELEAIRSEMVTKVDLEAQTKTLEIYTDEVAATILEAVNTGFETVIARLDSRDKKIETIEENVKQLKGALNLS